MAVDIETPEPWFLAKQIQALLLFEAVARRRPVDDVITDIRRDLERGNIPLDEPITDTARLGQISE